MSSDAKLYYDGSEFRLPTGPDRVDAVRRDATALLDQGGGFLQVETVHGPLSVLVGPGIPLAVIETTDRHTGGLTIG